MALERPESVVVRPFPSMNLGALARLVAGLVNLLLAIQTVSGENFDPAKADPQGRISCHGTPAVPLPTQPNFNPNLMSMQQLCAKPQYGGGARRRHLGFYCWDHAKGVVAMDISSRAQGSAALQKPRLALQCRARCFCEGWDSVANLAAKPLSKTYSHYSSETYEISADIEDDFSMVGLASGSLLHQYVPTTSVVVEEEGYIRHIQETRPIPFNAWYTRALDDPSIDPDWWPISLDPANFIECHGPMPTFPLPPPIMSDTFANRTNPLQAMCAVQLSHGHEYVVLLLTRCAFFSSIVRAHC